jgi:hypothetical protein
MDMHIEDFGKRLILGGLLKLPLDFQDFLAAFLDRLLEALDFAGHVFLRYGPGIHAEAFAVYDKRSPDNYTGRCGYSMELYHSITFG